MVFVCCSAEELPFKNNVCDYFISNAVLEHLPLEEEAICEIDRVCKDNAGLMITVPLSYKYLNPLFIPINYIHDKRIGHLRKYDRESLINKLTGGWKLLKVYYTGHFNKIIKVLVNMIIKVFAEEDIENDDRKKEDRKWLANNIICFFKR